MKQYPAVWVAGMGVLSSIGMNKEENLSALRSETSKLQPACILQTHHAFPVGEIQADNQSLGKLAGTAAPWPRTALLSCIAATEALDDFKMKLQQSGCDVSSLLKTARIAFVSGNTTGGMDKTEQFYPAFLHNPEPAAYEAIRYHSCGSITQLVASHLGLNTRVTTICTACSSSANTIMHACRLLKHNTCDIVIAGGADALCRFTLNGFHSLMILDKNRCTPFDENRQGLNLGEGAAYLVLVREDFLSQHRLTPYARVSGYANTNDAFHQTASSAEGRGNLLAMQQALQLSGLAPDAIDYINAHGTGTGNNDASEGRAIEQVFGSRVPPTSSTKAYTGHTLGAAGAIEAVYSCLALQHQLIYPNLRYTAAMKELTFTPVTTLLQQQPLRHVMSNSFGFGGNCSSLIFSNAS